MFRWKQVRREPKVCYVGSLPKVVYGSRVRTEEVGGGLKGKPVSRSVSSPVSLGGVTVLPVTLLDTLFSLTVVRRCPLFDQSPDAGRTTGGKGYHEET